MSIVKPIPVNLPFETVPQVQESSSVMSGSSDNPSTDEGSNTKHTCGPWRTQGWVPTWAYIPVKDARHNLVCSMYPDSGHGYTMKEVEANARLIVAAPELLAALKALDPYLDQLVCYASTLQEYAPNALVLAARKEIAKAEGAA